MKKDVADSEEINSDLDDSDTDGEEEDQEGALGETDIVFCTYDKVRSLLHAAFSRPNGTFFAFRRRPEN